MNQQLSPSIWYSIVLSGLITFLILYFSTRLAFRWLVSLITDAILKYLVYSTTSLFGISKWRISAKDAIFPLLYVSANGVCMGWGVKAAKELSRRSASMLATNLILLLPGSNVTADVLHISLRVYQKIHSIVGLIALIQASIHAGRELTAHGWTGNIDTISGVAVRKNVLALVLWSHASRHSAAWD
jgi:hypothetical protein